MSNVVNAGRSVSVHDVMPDGRRQARQASTPVLRGMCHHHAHVLVGVDQVFGGRARNKLSAFALVAQMYQVRCLQVQVLQTCTRVQLEYKYKYQVLRICLVVIVVIIIIVLSSARRYASAY